MYVEHKFDKDEVFVYLRKSRSDDPLLTVEEVLARHEARLDEWAEQNMGEKVPDTNKFREVVSGETIDDRPVFLELLRGIESPKIKAILVVEVQRLSRGDLEDAGRLIKLLRYTNTKVITVQPQRIFDIRDEYDRENFERELKRGNEFLEYQKKIQQNGRIQSVQQGNFIGQHAPYGYRKKAIKEGKRTCHTLEIDEKEADIVRMIFDMYVNQDMGCVKIAKHLNDLNIKTVTGGLWSQATLNRMLTNDHYIGKVRWNFRKTIHIVEDGEVKVTRPKSKVGEYLVFEGKHDAIISEELFRAAGSKKGRRTKEKPNTKIRNPLAGLVYCQCGRAMTYRTYLRKGVERTAPRLLCDNQAYCGTSSCTYDEMLVRVREILEQCIQDFEFRIKNDNQDSRKLHDNLINRLKAKQFELEKKEIAQWEAQADPDPEKRMPDHVFKVLNARLLKEKDEVQEALCKAYESMPEPIDYQERLVRFQDALDALNDPDASATKKNKLLMACIERIDYNREKLYRKTSTRKRITVNGKRIYVDAMNPEDRWSKPPIELDVKLRL